MVELMTLDIGCTISTPYGPLDLMSGFYDLHSDSFGGMSTSHRSVTVSGGRFLEGSFVTDTVRDNPTDTLAVWVQADNPYDYRLAVQALEASLDQLTYAIVITSPGLRETRVCTVADYVRDEQQAYRFATSGLVRATFGFLPNVTIEAI